MDTIDIRLTPDQLQAVTDVVGERVSATSREAGHDVHDTLWHAERELDGALMAWEAEHAQHTPTGPVALHRVFGRYLVWVAVWDDDGETNCQAYETREAAMRDFPQAKLVESTVQS